MALVAGAPLERAHRIAAGQVIGFAVLVAVAAAAAAVLFEFSTCRGRSPRAGAACPRPARAGGAGPAPARRRPTRRRRAARRKCRPLRPEQRAVGRSLTAAALITISGGGDNLAVYIPLFRVGGAANVGAILAVFVVGEVLVTWLVLAGGRHPKARSDDAAPRARGGPGPALLHRRAGHGAGRDLLAAVTRRDNGGVTDAVDALILDLLEWVGPAPRPYAEVMEAWRTSCPRLPVWEDANDRGATRPAARPRAGAADRASPPPEPTICAGTARPRPSEEERPGRRWPSSRAPWLTAARQADGPESNTGGIHGGSAGQGGGDHRWGQRHRPGRGRSGRRRRHEDRPGRHRARPAQGGGGRPDEQRSRGHRRGDRRSRKRHRCGRCGTGPSTASARCISSTTTRASGWAVPSGRSARRTGAGSSA